MMKVRTSLGILFSTDEDYNFPLFYHSSFFTDFAILTNANFAVSLFSRARVTGVLHFYLSQVSHFLVYYVVNDTIIAVLSFPLTIRERSFLKKSFGWM